MLFYALRKLQLSIFFIKTVQYKLLIIIIKLLLKLGTYRIGANSTRGVK